MGTRRKPTSLAAALFGQTRRAVLSLLYGHADQAYYLRQIVRATGLGVGTVQREVKRLTEAGILHREVRGRQVYYQADRQCPVFSELRSLVMKTVGVTDVLRSALAPLSDGIRVAFVYGSFARGEERAGSDVDLLVVGDVGFQDVVSALGTAQKKLSREVNPTVYPPSEFRAKLAAGHHFLTSVLRQEKLMLIGGQGELARLGAKRLARRAQN